MWHSQRGKGWQPKEGLFQPAAAERSLAPRCWHTPLPYAHMHSEHDSKLAWTNVTCSI